MILKCKNCGGDVIATGNTYGTCNSCGATMLLPKESDEQKSRSNNESSESSNKTATMSSDVATYTKRGFLLLEDANWDEAAKYFNKVLDVNPEYSQAYIGLLCAELEIKSEANLANYEEPVDQRSNYIKALRFANYDYRDKITGYNDEIKKRYEQGQTQREEKKLQLNQLRQKAKEYSVCIAAGQQNTVGLKTDGSVVAAGYNGNGQCNVSEWNDVVAVSVGVYHTVGLKADGSVIAIGSKNRGCNTDDWSNIVAVYAGKDFTVGFKADGTVVATGNVEKGLPQIQQLGDIVAVSACDNTIIGLKADGTVVGSSFNTKAFLRQTKDWSDIVAVSAGEHHVVGLKANGTVIAALVEDKENYYAGWDSVDVGQYNTIKWHDIIAVTAGSIHTAGLKADGTVVAVGSNGNEQCNVSDWSDIIAVAAGHHHTVGLKSDGTVVATGDNNLGQCNIEWQDIGLVNKELLVQKMYERNQEKQRIKQEEQRIMEEEQRKQQEEQRKRNEIEQSIRWAKQGLCAYCGGKMGGLFTKKCLVCGKQK